MKQLAIHNPATGALITELPADDATSVAAKAALARAAQKSWAATPLAERQACIQRFKAGVLAEIDSLAALMTGETGKPITMSRNELNGLMARIDFFVEEVDDEQATETVFTDAGMTEQIEHPPLGVVANISAWNYPWFVGGNVFIPALLTGNTVLYKPSEYAAQTGLAMARLLHAAGVPGHAFITLIGGGEVGAALLAQKIDGLFFTGSHATGARIMEALGPRLVKVQLELGGKDPTYLCRADVKGKTAVRLKRPTLLAFAFASGKDPFALYADPKAYGALMDEVGKAMVACKSNIKFYWDNKDQLLNSMRSGEVVGAMMWDTGGWKLNSEKPELGLTH